MTDLWVEMCCTLIKRHSCNINWRSELWRRLENLKIWRRERILPAPAQSHAWIVSVLSAGTRQMFVCEEWCSRNCQKCDSKEENNNEAFCEQRQQNGELLLSAPLRFHARRAFIRRRSRLKVINMEIKSSFSHFHILFGAAPALKDKGTSHNPPSR